MTAIRREDLPYRPCVGALLFNDRGEVLVARRADVREPAWQLPQGGIDGDETPVEALRRELREEIGTDRYDILAESPVWHLYDLPDAMLGHAFKGRFRGQRQRWFALRFTGRDADIDLGTGRHAEFDAWRWTPVESLPALAVAFKRDVYAALTAEFAPLARRLAGSG